MKDPYSFIEAYHKGKLDARQRAAFEEEMDADPDLKEAVENYWKIEPVLDLLLEEDIRSKINEIKHTPTKTIPLRRWISIAAAILLLVFAMYWIFTPKPVLTGPKMAELYYQAPPDMGSRGETADQGLTPQQIAIQNAHKMIQNNQNEDAEEILQSLVTLNSRQKPAAEWLLVITALQENNIDLARTRVSVILSDDQHPYYEKGKALANDLQMNE